MFTAAFTLEVLEEDFETFSWKLSLSNMNYIMDCVYGGSESSSPKATLSLGKIIGRVRETAKGNEFVSFTRIPYAQPPVGKQRHPNKKQNVIPYVSHINTLKENCSTYD